MALAPVWKAIRTSRVLARVVIMAGNDVTAGIIRVEGAADILVGAQELSLQQHRDLASYIDKFKDWHVRCNTSHIRSNCPRKSACNHQCSPLRFAGKTG
jgi:hypothetical protein